MDYIDKFLESQNLLRLYHQEIEYLNRSMTNNESESVIWKSLNQKTIPPQNPRPDAFTAEFKHLKKN